MPLPAVRCPHAPALCHAWRPEDSPRGAVTVVSPVGVRVVMARCRGCGVAGQAVHEVWWPVLAQGCRRVDIRPLPHVAGSVDTEMPLNGAVPCRTQAVAVATPSTLTTKAIGMRLLLAWD